MAYQDEELAFLFNNVFLPPQLPCIGDCNKKSNLHALITVLIQSSRHIQERIHPDHHTLWSGIRRCLSSFQDLHARSGTLDHLSLLKAFSDVIEGDVVVVYVALQNCCLIFRKTKDHVVIEAFEASPPAAEVLASVAALQRDFPSRAVEIATSDFADPSLQKEIATFIEQASLESVKEFAATSVKAGAHVYENRDTVHPAIIGQLLMSILEANGQLHKILLTRKRIRDDACWTDGAEIPWRRSPVWLALRVAIQRTLCLSLGGPLGTIHYKIFVASVHAHICNRLALSDTISPDWIAFSRTKLARRLAKLQQQVNNLPVVDALAGSGTFATYKPHFEECLALSNHTLNQQWEQIRSLCTKRVTPLPWRATANNTTLSLFNSRPVLMEIIEEEYWGHPAVPIRLVGRDRTRTFDSSWATHGSTASWDLTNYLELAQFEKDLQSLAQETILQDTFIDPAADSGNLLEKMRIYHQAAMTAYGSNPEQLSAMALLLFEIWQALDTIALRSFPMLAEYDPGFPKDLLWLLQATSSGDMQRLNHLEAYINIRRPDANASLPSIFGNISGDSFGARYFDQDLSMQQAMTEIVRMDNKAIADKKEELKTKTAEYEGLLRDFTMGTCLYFEDPFKPGTRRHDQHNCRKCFSERQLERMRIRIHEAMLPADESQAKAVIFELLLPQTFASWRQATWHLLRMCRPEPITKGSPKLFLYDYAGLKHFCGADASFISLASRTKSFYNTHYSLVPFPTTSDKVCLAHGLKYGLFDSETFTWTSGQSLKPSLASICSQPLPKKSAFGSVEYCLLSDFGGKSFTANDVIASQTSCPKSLTVPEFLAFQELRHGHTTPWLKLLRELAASNINFGATETLMLVTQLAFLAGPPESNSPLRARHWVFADSAFCLALASQIHKRLQSIHINWRESHVVQCCLLLLQRMHALTTSDLSRKETATLVVYVRSITRNWTRLLRHEICNASDIDAAQRRSQDALLAALICRKTFFLEVGQEERVMESDALVCFIECAVCIKQNLPSSGPGYISKMSDNVRQLYIGDLKLLHQLEPTIRLSIGLLPEAVSQAINVVWSEEKEGAWCRSFTCWEFLHGSQDWWITAKSIARNGMIEQDVHFNVLDGTMLIAGQPLGRLPDEYSRQAFFKQLLGSCVFMAYPSNMGGMSHMLASPFEEHLIHFGSRSGEPFMRAQDKHGRVFELVQPEVFLPRDSRRAPDLPLPLIYDHAHWFDIKAKIIEIRPEKTKWRVKWSDWKLDLNSCVAFRRTSRLVDPQSTIFGRVASILEPFEHRSRMVVFQPEKRNLSVHLPSLKLSFEVNSEGLLHCQHLRAIIDENQDAGALYGLDSKLVLRDEIVQQDRMVIVAMGTYTVAKQGIHVRAVTNPNDGFYARFHINKILQRLECAIEPRLVYFKAYCHAITSFVVADPLTGRTGVEEALACLRAGNAQPYDLLDPASIRILESLAELTPKRSYYPEDMQQLQKPVWVPELTSLVQHDDFLPLVEELVQQSELLRSFTYEDGPKPRSKYGKPCRLLHERAKARNGLFRPLKEDNSAVKSVDRIYHARDTRIQDASRNSFEAAALAKRWSARINTTADLAGILQSWPSIQGYGNTFDAYLLTDLIDFDFAAHWGSLYSLCTGSSRVDRHKLMFLFATISFNRNADMALVRSLIAMSIVEDFSRLEVPIWPSYTSFRPITLPNVRYISKLFEPYRIPYSGDIRAEFPVALNPKQRRRFEQLEVEHIETSQRSCAALADHILSQWPQYEVSFQEVEDLPKLDVPAAVDGILVEWHRLIENHDLSRHIANCQSLLNRCKAPNESHLLGSSEFAGHFSISRREDVRPTMSHLQAQLNGSGSHNSTLAEASCRESTANGEQDSMQVSGLSELPRDLGGLKESGFIVRSISTPSILQLQTIVNAFIQRTDVVRCEYGKDLQRSLNALNVFAPIEPRAPASSRTLLEMIVEAQSDVGKRFDDLCAALTRDWPWQTAGALLPDITPTTILELMRGNSATTKVKASQSSVVAYGKAITKLQHLLRIERAWKRNDMTQITDEIQHIKNHGRQGSHDNDWLLLQIDFNFLIRPDQLQVAEAMIAPASGASSVLQMNMGLGKSSVIIPMIVTRLSNRKKLARVVVPRPLLLQMGQLLQARLGGLLGRSLKHVPFSRKSRTTHGNIEAYYSLHKEMLRQQGVMLCLPEHMLSFQLSGLQELVNGHVQQADHMLQIQTWLSLKCRDILDESDHMLAVRTQLIYPSGSQRVVDGHPLRWTLMQNLLKLVKPYVRRLRREWPRSIEVIDRCPGSFPIIYLLDQRVKDVLINELTEGVLRGEGSILPVDRCDTEDLQYARRFLRSASFKENAGVGSSFYTTNTDVRQHLLLLRGLLVHRILLMALGKRFNVMYGIHPDRDPIAVPFRAKGIPSDQAEFGHPDVAILLTCLSFYYSGLTPDQFRQCLAQLVKSDEPAEEYESWFADVNNLPDSLRTWNSINIDDEIQCQQLWAPLRQQMSTVNYFLNNFVFPRHAKTFERKIVSSGWDLPASPCVQDLSENMKENLKPTINENRAKTNESSLTTGFSGTSDNKTLLPLNIRQNDLPGLAHTNAEVLTYLLQPRNRRYLAAADKWGKRLTEREFLLKLSRLGIRMLLDAGALISELDNLALVKVWLEVDSKAEAAVFFGRDGRARALYKDSKQQPLSASPFLNNLDACVVYLDEAHTRGVDLKMPANTVAALTLGMMQTKDHTVQAAMRLRQLAISQSIVFFAPPEVHSSILNFSQKTSQDQIDSSDVIMWLLEMTCCNIEQLQPLYISQGLDYCRRILSARKNPDKIHDAKQRAAYLKVLEQPEQYSLEQLYGPSRKTKRHLVAARGFAELEGYVEKLNDMRREISDTIDTVQASAHQEVEQEREVAIEVEAVRERKNPHRATGLPQPRLNKDVERFVATGRLGTNTWAFQQMFVALRLTALGQRLGINGSATTSSLYITQDFGKTIVTDHRPRDEYSRPVHWVLWSSLTSVAVIVSDYEADALLPVIRAQRLPLVHLIVYTAPVTKSMLVFDTLKVYSIPQLPHNWRAPAWLVRDLGLFAGRLYFDYDKQYAAVSQALGLPPPKDTPSTMDEDMTEEELWRELPFNEAPREKETAVEPFSKSPLLFMQEWLSLRRKGQDFSQTMMGEICRGRRLARDSGEERPGPVEESGDVEVDDEQELSAEGGPRDHAGGKDGDGYGDGGGHWDGNRCVDVDVDDER
ncbi:MAG: hypothetical protein MMC23_008371 [Stictis urceolatum]|nr:hypothetical protein [Stictis urceolata]